MLTPRADHASVGPRAHRSRRRRGSSRRSSATSSNAARPTTSAHAGRPPLAADARRQQLLVGAWLNDEIALVNQDRMRGGEAPLDGVGRPRPARSCAGRADRHRSARAFHVRSARRRDRRQLAPVDVGDVQRRPQGRRRSAVGLAGRPHRVPEAARPAEGRHRRGSARHAVADADVPGRRRLARGDGARRARRARHLHPPANRDPPFRAASRRARRARPSWAVPDRPRAAAAGDGAVRLHDPRQRAARRRQDDACSPSCWARCHLASASSRSRRTCSSCGSRTTRATPTRRRLFTRSRQRRGRGRDHDSPAGRTDAPPQPRSRRRRRARRGRGARHARRRVDVQARLAGDDPCPHLRRRAAAPRLLRRQVERQPARVRGVEPDRPDRRLRDPHRPRAQRRATTRARRAV